LRPLRESVPTFEITRLGSISVLSAECVRAAEDSARRELGTGISLAVAPPVSLAYWYARKKCRSREQARARVFAGITQLPGKIVSLFEPHTEIIRKGKASKPTEFGKLVQVQVQEAENQIITHYDVFDQRPSDRDLFLGAVENHERVLGRVPNLATADAGYYSREQEQAAEEKGVKWVAVPNRSTKSAERKKKEHSRWFKKAQRWRTGCEGASAF
jgi:hypothetical protein